MPNRPVASKISRSSRTSNLADRLCGSVPMITRPITGLPVDPTASVIGEEGNASTSRADPS